MWTVLVASVGCVASVRWAYFEILWRQCISNFLGKRNQLLENWIFYQVLCNSRAFEEGVNVDVTMALDFAKFLYWGECDFTTVCVFVMLCYTQESWSDQPSQGFAVTYQAKAVKILLLSSYRIFFLNGEIWGFCLFILEAEKEGSQK